MSSQNAFPTSSGISGFQPAFGFPSQGFISPIQQLDGEELEPEEIERIQKAESEKQERSRNAYIKSEEESLQKQGKKTAAKQQLMQWEAERKRQIALRKQTNQQQEQEYHSEIKRLKTTTNPWERIVSNVEINQANYIG